MTPVMVVTDHEQLIDADVQGSRLIVDGATVTALTGWEVRPEGLCRGDVCVPVREDLTGPDIDLGAVADALGSPFVFDADDRVAAFGQPTADRHLAGSRQAPTFRLPDLDGTERDLAELRGRKKLLVAFASW